MKIKAIAAAIVATTAAFPLLAADTYKVDPDHSFPSYEIKHFGFSLQRGRFTKVGGTITLDKAAKNGSADITIDAASVATDNPKVADHLRKEEFFNVAQYPSITFKSSKFVFNGDALAKVEGDLTMRGVTKPVVLDVSSFRCAPHPLAKKEACGADASVTVKRSDYGIKAFLPAIADEAKLVINIEAIKAD